MGRRARWGMVTAALVLAVSSSAKADDDRANREAEARFKEGLARVKSKDFEAARLSFEQAYAVLHRPLILWNLALSEEKTSHTLEALGHFRQVAREAPGDASTCRRPRARSSRSTGVAWRERRRLLTR
jgi:tetratricopeptide (TPR) repeat protein